MITQKTKIILYNLSTENYIIGTVKDKKKNVDLVPVCTVAHFFDCVCKLFEEVTPKMGSNPMFQQVDWKEALEAE